MSVRYLCNYRFFLGMHISRKLVCFFATLITLYVILNPLFISNLGFGKNSIILHDKSEVKSAINITDNNAISPSAILNENEMQLHTYALNERFEGYQLFILCRRTIPY